MTKIKSIHELLGPIVHGLNLRLSARQMEQLALHFDLLRKWNRRINLTSVRRPEEIATRHFGESLFLAKLLPQASGLLVDVGSGAGFPGLPLKVAWPEVETVLLEPNKKKAAFLKEVVRHCGLEGVEVRTERLEEAARGNLAGCANLVTMRAVTLRPHVLGDLKKLLRADGQLALFVGQEAAVELAKSRAFQWQEPAPLPGSQRRVIVLARPVVPSTCPT